MYISSLLAPLAALACCVQKAQGWLNPPSTPLSQLHKRHSSSSIFSKRSVTSFDIDPNLNNQTYGVVAEVGTPPQKQIMMLCVTCEATSTYVLSKDAEFDCGPDGVCDTYDTPMFDSAASSTFKSNGSEDATLFVAAYGNNITGPYFKDKVSIGDLHLDNMTLGLAKNIAVRWSMLALGFSRMTTELPTLTSLAKQQGYIAADAFSIWLNGAYDKRGKLLLGAVDKAKYSGDLVFIPTDKTRPETRRYRFNLRSMSIHDKDSKPIQLLQSHPSTLVFFDPTDSINNMPADVAETIYRIVDARPARNQTIINDPLVPCSLLESKETLNLTFGDDSTFTNIVIPIPDLVVPQERVYLQRESDRELLKADDGTKLCPFEIFSTSPTTTDQSLMTFGVTALWSMYMTWDLERKQVGIAQAKKDVSEEDIVEYDEKGIPGAKTATPTASFSGIPLQTETGTPPSPTASAGDSGKNESSSTHVEVGPWYLCCLVMIILLLQMN